jgi:hypothetical protein
MDPCQEFQGPNAEEVPRLAPYARIVPCIGVDCPKVGLPPVGKELMRRCCYQTFCLKKMVSNLLAYYVKVVLDSSLQINYGV